MLVLRVSPLGLVRAASVPALCALPVFSLFADQHLHPLLHAMARATLTHDHWLSNLYWVLGGACYVDVCVRRVNNEIALAVVAAANPPVAPWLEDLKVQTEVLGQDGVCHVAPPSPTVSAVSSVCGDLVSDESETEVDEEAWLDMQYSTDTPSPTVPYATVTERGEKRVHVPVLGRGRREPNIIVYGHHHHVPFPGVLSDFTHDDAIQYDVDRAHHDGNNNEDHGYGLEWQESDFPTSVKSLKRTHSLAW